MSEMTRTPTHHRLLSALKAIGPYLREPQSQEGFYLFDCLSVCIDDKKSPEKREFWGWWMELRATDDGFQARYHVGRYDVAGDWQPQALPKKSVEEVNRTQAAFHEKLVSTLQEKFELSVELHKESQEFV